MAKIPKGTRVEFDAPARSLKGQAVEYDGPTPEEAAATPMPEPSRMNRILEQIKTGARRAYDYHQNPLATAALLTDMTPTGLGGAVIHGAGKVASAGFIDELEGVRGALSEARRPMLSKGGAELENLSANPQSMFDAYVSARDQRSRDDNASYEAHPFEFGAAGLAAGLALPFGKAKLAGRLAQAGAYGALSGVGNSEARTGESAATVEDMASAAGEGMDLGLATGGVFEAGTAVPRAIASKGARMVTGARSALVDKGDALLAKDATSERGRLGGLTTGLMGDAQRVKEGLVNPNLEAHHRTSFRDTLDSSEFVEMERNAADNLIGRIPGNSSRLTEARAAYAEAAKRNTPEGAQQYADAELAKSAFATQAAPRIGRFLQRTIPAVAGTAIGGALGGVEGALAGSVGGSVIGAAMGHQGTAFANMMKAPVVRDRIGRALQGAGGVPVSASVAATPGTINALEEYMRPMDDEERQRKAAAQFTSGTGGR